MPNYGSSYDDGRIALIKQLIPLGEGSAVDVGCNEGWIVDLLSSCGYQAVGVDPDEAAVSKGRETFPGLDLRIGTIADIAPSFNLVTCFEVIEHLDNLSREALLRDVLRILEPDGTFVISTPGRFSLYSLMERAFWRVTGKRGYCWWDETHVNVSSFSEIERLLRRAGFTIEKSTGYFFIPRAIMRPFQVDWKPLKRAGFDLFFVCRSA